MQISLATQLNRLGYTSKGYHANSDMYGRLASHSNLGYDWIQKDTGFTMETTGSGNDVWPQSDHYMMEQSINDYINGDTPFNVYYMTISGHMPYNFTGDMMSIRNQSVVDALPYSEETKAYLAANYELEKALTYLVEQLEQAGVADKTMIVLTADHIPYFNVDVLEELAGKSFGSSDLSMLKESDIDFDVYKNSLIIWSGSMKEPVQVDKLCSQVDILPTLSNLLGLEYDSRLMAGTDILSDSAPLVVFSSQCWLSDKGLYNRYTEEFTPAPNINMSQEDLDTYVEAMKKAVRYKLDASSTVVATDYYNTVFPR
jgi:lipoteichoic acid synthase